MSPNQFELRNKGLVTFFTPNNNINNLENPNNNNNMNNNNSN